MDIAKGVCFKLKKILSQLKLLKIIRSFTYRVDFEKVDEDDREYLMQLDDLLGKCIEKMRWKPKRAEIRKVIGELMRKKNIQQNILYDSHERNYFDIRNNRIKKEAKSRRRLQSKKDSLLPSSNEKTYLCEFCGHRFTHYSRLGSHIFKIHKKENFIIDEEYGFLVLANESEPQVDAELENNDTCNSYRGANCLSQGLNNTGEPCPYHKGLLARGRDNNSYEVAEVSTILKNKEKSSKEDTNLERSKGYCCSVCHKSFRLERSLRKHVRLKHSCDAQNIYPCTRCKKTFTEQGKLNRHLLIHKRGQFQCLHCNKSFHRMDNLRRHFSLIHQQLKSFQCQYCHKGFSLKFNRDVHERNVHVVGAEIECELCGKKCKNKTTFNEHKKIHEKNPFSCTLCSKKFMRKLQYRNHLKNKHKGISPFQKLFDSVAKTASDSST